jgi:hypothetical protein
MLDELRTRTGVLPTTLLADANHATHACIEAASHEGVEVLIAVPEHEKNASSARRKPSPEVAAWRARMQTPEAKETFRARASLCELANAHVKDRLGLDHFLVRGTGKVTRVVLLVGISFNLLQHAIALLA